jgi:CheY-like chemotaxis protein
VRFALTTGSRENKPFVIATVEDTGIGIKNEDKRKLFGTFQQLDPSKNRGVTGTGLGLAITKNFLDMMGGFIEVQSEYGKGSRFTVYFPLVEGDPHKVESAHIVPVMARDNTTVLVVDDMPENLTVAKEFLVRHNVKADTVLSGVEALTLVQEADKAGRPYELIFMDHMMPDMDGLETTQRLRAQGFHKPIIALSANAVTGALEVFRAAGMDDFLAKPIEVRQLNAILARWLPPEKMVVDEEKTQSTPAILSPPGDSASLRKELWAALRQIPALDVDKGLSHVAGEQDVYFQVLRQFCNGMDETVSVLRESAEKEDWPGFAVRAHGIKGVLKTIGQDDLADRAFALEKAGKAADAVFCQSAGEPFCAALRDFRDALLKSGLMEATQEQKQKTPVTPEEFRALLQALRTALASYREQDIDQAVSRLKESAMDKQTDAVVEKICELAASFDYDEAEEKIAALLG